MQLRLLQGSLGGAVMALAAAGQLRPFVLF
jgi:hypothetical protein